MPSGSGGTLEDPPGKGIAAPLDNLTSRPFATATTGAPALPAPWALGPLLWRDENSDQAQVLDDISQIRTRHLATTGIWFDRPYSTGVETFDFSAAKFPDPHAGSRIRTCANR